MYKVTLTVLAKHSMRMVLRKMALALANSPFIACLTWGDCPACVLGCLWDFLRIHQCPECLSELEILPGLFILFLAKLGG